MLANWWTRLATVVAAIRRHRNRRNGCKQIRALSMSLTKLLGDIPGKAEQALRPQKPVEQESPRKGHQSAPQPLQGMGRQPRGAGSTALQSSGRALGPARTHRPE
eukprot:6709254-Pyramimonas_sp.AAC.1